MQRRSVLVGLAGLGVAGLSVGCSHADGRVAAARDIALDFSELEARHGGRLGLCAIDGDDRVSWRGEERFATASTFKLFLAGAVLERAARGETQLDRAIPIRQADLMAGAPVAEAAVGGTLTIEALCAATIRYGDNTAANLLFDVIGGPAALTAYYRSLGDTVSRSDRIEPDLNSAIPGDPRDTASPCAAAAGIGALLLGDRLSPADRERLELWLTTSIPGPGRIKAGVPAGWRVGHKTGSGRYGATNDIGILWPPSGAPITIAVYFTETDAPPPAMEAVIADATRLALTALGHG